MHSRDKLKKIHTYKFSLALLLVAASSGVISYLFQQTIIFLMDFAHTNESFTLRSFIFSISFVLVSYFLTKTIFKETEGSGIPQVKLSLAALKGRFPRRMPFGKFITSVLTLSSGLKLGQEGPLVTISASLAHLYARMFNLTKEGTKLLVVAGAASGLSAAFNTPIAAVVFTIEEIMGELNSKYIGPIIIASVTASVVSFNILGSTPVFGLLHYTHENEWHLIFYMFLGLFISLIGYTWITTILFLKKLKARLPEKFEFIFAVITIVLVGACTIIIPPSAQSGHDVIVRFLEQDMEYAIVPVLILFVFKFFATSASYCTGLSGGIFMPALSLGALGGVLFASVLQQLGFAGIEVGAFALLGMTSYLVSTVRVPFTAFIMLFEMTRNYDMILPLMVSSVSSYFISQLLSDESIYETIAEYEGVHLPSHKDKEVLEELEVESCMIRDVISFQSYQKIGEIKEQIEGLKVSGFPILEGNQLFGIISKDDILQSSDEAVLKNLASRDIITIYPDQSFLIAIEKFKRFKISRIPVISRYNKKKMVGIITMETIVDYIREQK